MKIKKFIFLILIAFIAACISIIAFSLVSIYENGELNEISTGFQIVLYAFTASISSLGILKYWDSVSKKQEENNWNKFEILNILFQEFKKQNSEIIIVLDWPHLFENKLNLMK